MKNIIFVSAVMLLCSCGNNRKTVADNKQADINSSSNRVSIVVLGNVQDAGSPHVGCNKDCCRNLFENPDKNRQIVCLGVFDGPYNKKYLFEATPDFPRQIKKLKRYEVETEKEAPDGIFVTHAHIGHYTGLMFLGKEAMDAKEVPVYAMPKMKHFLENNGPWNQLVTRKNIVIKELHNEQTIKLSDDLEVTPILVPHRDEYSETVGFYIKGPTKTALFIPDIDKWDQWDKDIAKEVEKVDYAFLDATFYSGKELGYRDISQIPHPFVVESFDKFKNLSAQNRKKIIFIHINHTNPALDAKSAESKIISEKGFKIARINDIFEL